MITPPLIVELPPLAVKAKISQRQKQSNRAKSERGVGNGEWGMEELLSRPHSPLPTPHSLFTSPFIAIRNHYLLPPLRLFRDQHLRDRRQRRLLFFSRGFLFLGRGFLAVLDKGFPGFLQFPQIAENSQVNQSLSEKDILDNIRERIGYLIHLHLFARDHIDRILISCGFLFSVETEVVTRQRIGKDYQIIYRERIFWDSGWPGILLQLLIAVLLPTHGALNKVGIIVFSARGINSIVIEKNDWPNLHAERLVAGGQRIAKRRLRLSEFPQSWLGHCRSRGFILFQRILRKKSFPHYLFPAYLQIDKNRRSYAIWAWFLDNHSYRLFQCLR